MSDDEFSKQAGKAFQTVALGLAGAAGGPAGVALTVAGSALFNIFDAVASANTLAFQEARISQLEDEVRRVADVVRTLQEARVNAGKPVDAPDAAAQTVIFSDFAEAVSAAATPEKRTALVHAAARQFDPDVGPLPVRKHWFGEIRRLSDIQIVALLLLQEQAHLIFSGNDTFGYGGDPNSKPRKLTLVFTERVAIENTVIELQQRTKLVTLGRPVPSLGHPYHLTWSGHAIARIMTDAVNDEA